jgi:hypothetical protein
MNQCWSIDFMFDNLFLIDGSEHLMWWMITTERH